jgi:hypothetical protein
MATHPPSSVQSLSLQHHGDVFGIRIAFFRGRKIKTKTFSIPPPPDLMPRILFPVQYGTGVTNPVPVYFYLYILKYNWGGGGGGGVGGGAENV